MRSYSRLLTSILLSIYFESAAGVPLHHKAAQRLHKDLSGTMRQNIRPFVTVYKNRSTKSLKPNLWGTRLLEEEGSRQPSVNAADVPQPMGERDKRCRASTKTAPSEVYSSGQVAEPIATPTGRILPCLLQSAPQIDPLQDFSENVSHSPAKRKPTKTEADYVTATEVRADVIVTIHAKPAVEPVELPAANASLENSSARRSSRIQDRWVRKTELKAGERWKRRLSHVAR